ncbi:DUF1007 family protein [Oceanidesulfovibrio indonesiensis]|nr:DUF1007 family protein [Oceanidesulfovibrio indonesiensis]
MHRVVRVLACCLFLLALPAAAAAHPHAFIEAHVAFRFDEQGLAGFEQRWRLDPMLTATLLDLVDADRDRRLSADELVELDDISMGSLKDFSFFTFVLIDGQKFEVASKSEFTAYMEDDCMIYEFFIPCRVHASDTAKTVKVAIYDPTFFSFVALVDKDGGAGIDPTQDPLFGDPMAQAAPGDYERFIDATGFERQDVEPAFSGPVDAFAVEASLEPAEDMAYFEGLIIPDAFVVAFSST